MPELPLSVRLTVPSEPQQVGAPVQVSIAVRNISDQPLWIIGVLEGSELGLRYPHYLPQITGPQPLPAVEIEYDMLAPLRLQDFRRLAAGESFDPTAQQNGEAYLPLYTFTNFRPPAPGRYELRLTLSTESTANEQWMGGWELPGKEQAQERLTLVPRLRVDSNVAIIMVE